MCYFIVLGDKLILRIVRIVVPFLVESKALLFVYNTITNHL